MPRLLISALSVLFALPMFAQTPAPHGPPPNPAAEQIAHMKQLQFMAGTWQGRGWMMLGPGKRAEFTQTEIVTPKLNGAIMTVDGDGRDAADASRHIHDAFAVISWDEATGFHWMPFSGGHTLDVTPTVGDRTFQWGFDAPYGKMRFTLDYTKTDTWHEVGEMSRDGGKTWTQNFEMTLIRKP